MTEANQTAITTDAREASKSRVQTQDTILAKLAPPEAAPAPAPAPAADAETNKDEGDSKLKSKSDRFHDLVARRKDAERERDTERARAEAAEREREELKARIDAMQAKPAPIEAHAKPVRQNFADEESFIEAMTDWKMGQREQAKAEAEQRVAQAEIQRKWEQRTEAFAKDMPDFAEVVAKAEERVPDYAVVFLRKSPVGAHLLYYLSMHPDEARQYRQLDAIDGIARLRDLERDLSEMEKSPAKEEKAKESLDKPQKSKAPPPIEPVKSVPSSSGASASNYEEYKRRRNAGKS